MLMKKNLKEYEQDMLLINEKFKLKSETLKKCIIITLIELMLIAIISIIGYFID